MSIIEYHRSTANELISLMNRVRNFVPHWSEDGRHKEVILKSIIKRFLPSAYELGSGFIIKTDSVQEHISSSQIDIIIYDSHVPVLFKEGDFVILTCDAVKAIIEVKTNVQSDGLGDALEKANMNGEFIYNGNRNIDRKLFNAIFSYEGYEGNTSFNIVRDTIIESRQMFLLDANSPQYIVNYISLNNNLFYRHWNQFDDIRNIIYNVPNLSFSFFISSLMDYLNNASVIGNAGLWFPNDDLEIIIDF